MASETDQDLTATQSNKYSSENSSESDKKDENTSSESSLEPSTKRDKIQKGVLKKFNMILVI